MDSLIFAAVVGLTVFLFMRRMKMLKQQKRRQAEMAEQGGVPEEAGEQESMPRRGTPGTITRDQIKQLKANHFEPQRLWSREEAQLILDAVTYMRAAIYAVTQETDPPLEVQNRLLKLILADENLREYVYEWGLNRAREDETAEYPTLERDDAFATLEAAILQEWSSS